MMEKSCAIILMIILTAGFGYYAVLSWFRPEIVMKFRLSQRARAKESGLPWLLRPILPKFTRGLEEAGCWIWGVRIVYTVSTFLLFWATVFLIRL